jgi:hypothetical protein
MAVVIRAADAAARLVLAPLVALALITWWLVGDISEPGAEDVLFRFALAERHSTLLGLVGLAIAAACAVDWWTRWNRSGSRGTAAWLTILGANAGFLAGFALRIITARVHGANIGGGMVLLGSPFGAVALLVSTAWLLRRLERTRGQRT